MGAIIYLTEKATLNRHVFRVDLNFSRDNDFLIYNIFIFYFLLNFHNQWQQRQLYYQFTHEHTHTHNCLPTYPFITHNHAVYTECVNTDTHKHMQKQLCSISQSLNIRGKYEIGTKNTHKITIYIDKKYIYNQYKPINLFI